MFYQFVHKPDIGDLNKILQSEYLFLTQLAPVARHHLLRLWVFFSLLIMTHTLFFISLASLALFLDMKSPINALARSIIIINTVNNPRIVCFSLSFNLFITASIYQNGYLLTSKQIATAV